MTPFNGGAPVSRPGTLMTRLPKNRIWRPVLRENLS